MNDTLKSWLACAVIFIVAFAFLALVWDPADLNDKSQENVRNQTDVVFHSCVLGCLYMQSVEYNISETNVSGDLAEHVNASQVDLVNTNFDMCVRLCDANAQNMSQFLDEFSFIPASA